MSGSPKSRVNAAARLGQLGALKGAAAELLAQLEAGEPSSPPSPQQQQQNEAPPSIGNRAQSTGGAAAAAAAAAAASSSASAVASMARASNLDAAASKPKPWERKPFVPQRSAKPAT
eukprot:5929322-Prymnesium_polylepis.1